MTAETVTHHARLSARERREYDEAGDQDRRWFACRPEREYRLRPAEPSEARLLAGRLPVTHVLVRKVHQHCRLRLPVLWTIAGDLPDDDVLLGRLAAGVAFTGRGGHA